MRRRSKAAAVLGFPRLIGPPESGGEGGSGKVKTIDAREAGAWEAEVDIKSVLKVLFGK
jgi:hypothetical protein